MDRNTGIKVYLVATVFALTTGLSFLAAKTTLVYAAPLEALFFRFAAAFLFALFVIAVKGGMKNFKGKRLGPLLIPALLYAGGFFGFQFFGLLYASSVEAGIIMAVQPAITMIVAELAIKEKPSLSQRLCVAAAILAAAFLSAYGSVGGAEMDFRGILLIFLSALSMAGNVVYIRWISRDYSPMAVSFVSCAFGFLLYTAVILISGGMKGTLGHTFGLIAEPKFLGAILFLGIGCTMLTTLMNSYLMIYLEAIKVSVMGCAGTIITLLTGHFVLGEALTGVQIAGSVVILAAIVGTNYFGGPAQKNRLEKEPADKEREKEEGR